MQHSPPYIAKKKPVRTDLTPLCLHAMWGCAADWSYWKNRFDCHSTSLDLRGSGDPANLNGVSIDRYASRVIETLDRLPGKAVLIGHSMGGLIAQRAAFFNPSKVAGLVLLASAQPRTEPRVKPPFRMRYVKYSWHIFVTGKAFRPTKKDARFITGELPIPLGYESGLAVRQVLRGTIMIPRLHCPLKVIRAEHDQFQPPEFGDAIARHYGSTCTVLPGQHYFHLDPATRERVFDEVSEWIELL